MAQQRKGCTKTRDGKLYARLTYTDETGKRHELMRRAENKTHAKEIIKQLIRELDDHGSTLVKNEHKTFTDLAEYYKANYLIEAKYSGDRKIAGLRSKRQVANNLNNLVAHFGQQKLRTITSGHIHKYKLKRLETKKFKKDPKEDTKEPSKKIKKKIKETPEQTLSIAYVNRELALLRRLFTIAQQEGWIIKNPFSLAKGIISTADEKKRERILTKEEENRLLQACSGVREHLRAILICALDTGMRQGEIFKLRWTDIDWANQIINVQAFNTKTMKKREVVMTTRLEEELWKLYQVVKDHNTLVFGIETNCKKAFSSARAEAKLTDLRFHDLRHTAATRLIQQGIPLQEVGRILGHTQANTTYRYVNANTDTARRAAEAMNEFHKVNEQKQQQKETREDDQDERIN